MPALNDEIVGYLTVNSIAFATGDWRTAQPQGGADAITYWNTAKLGTQPSQAQLDAAYPTYLDQLKAAENKAKAQQLLSETDWASFPSVADPSNSPYLKNADEFQAYRQALRVIAVTPTASAVFPTKPVEVWG
jgi:hypothetical protein